jgi:hypothetical protein
MAYQAATVPCRSQMLDGYRQIVFLIATIAREYFDALDLIYLGLAQGRISYGEANRAKVELDGLYERAWQGLSPP